MDKVIDLYAELAFQIGKCFAEYPLGFAIEMNSYTLSIIQNATPIAWVSDLTQSKNGCSATYEGIPIVVNNNLKVLQIRIKDKYKGFSEEETGEYERKVSTKD